MRAMWIATPTATSLGLGNDFFDRRPGHVTPPGAAFLKNSEQLYGLWFFAINNFMEWQHREQGLQIGDPDENGLRTFQGRASFGALRTTSYWLTAILATLIEAYIKDALTFAASSDSAIMRVSSGAPHSLRNPQSTAQQTPGAAARKWARQWLRRHGIGSKGSSSRVWAALRSSLPTGCTNSSVCGTS